MRTDTSSGTGNKLTVFTKMSGWRAVYQLPIFKDNISLALTKDQCETYIIFKNSECLRSFTIFVPYWSDVFICMGSELFIDVVICL